MVFAGAQHINDATLSGGTSGTAFSTTAVANWTGNTGVVNALFGSNSATDVRWEFRPTNSFDIFNGNALVSQTAVAGTFRRLQGVFTGGAGSVAVVDGSAGTSGNSGSNTPTGWQIGQDANLDLLTGDICEFGVWVSTTFSGPNQTSADTNMKNYWGL
jgi:hypothetical protein